MATTKTTNTAIECDLCHAQIPHPGQVTRLSLVDERGRATRFVGTSPVKADVCPKCATKPGLAELISFLRSETDPEEMAALMGGID